MLYTEFNLEEALRVREEEGEKRGVAIGEKRGVAIGEKRGVAIGEKRTSQRIAMGLLDVLDEETIASKTGLTVEEVRELKKNGLHE